MLGRNELSFVCDVFKKSHVNVTIAEKDALKSVLSKPGLGDMPDKNFILAQIVSALAPRTLYRLTDAMECSFRLFLIPDTEKPTVFCCGPFLSSPLSPGHILEISEKNGISAEKHRYLNEYYASLPVLSQESHLLTMLHTLCERLFKSPSFAIQDIITEQADILLNRSAATAENSDTLVKIRAMERRYAFENEMMRAVELGNSQVEERLRATFSDQLFEKRVSDPLRNSKNYSIIMNTLLRKAAERGGVHPIHLDEISSTFAVKIEEMTSLSEPPKLMGEMLQTYCRLVRKHSLKNLPLTVQKAVLLIDSDISADLSPKVIAERLNVTPGYLSAVFRKATGKTVSAYLRECRMEYAMHLLRTTSLQVQTVAMHCGILDVQYFSKLFKNQTGITPSEYRLGSNAPSGSSPP